MDKDYNSINVNSAKQTEVDNIPEVVASLKMLAVNMPEKEEVPPSTNPRRSLRKRTRSNPNFSSINRRCSLKPVKRKFSEMTNEDEIKEYYLDKTVKKNTNSLETIFEERDDCNQSTACMSVKRFKRMIQFSQEPTDSKLKKRRERIRKVFGSKVNYKKRRNVSMQALLDKLNGLQNNLSLNNESK